MAGYDPNQVRDEKGLAKWVGLVLLPLGFGLLVGGLIYLLPSEPLSSRRSSWRLCGTGRSGRRRFVVLSCCLSGNSCLH